MPYAGDVTLSRMQLHRKLKALTNQSATEIVRHLRLQRAAELLRQRSASVSEIAYDVGFESLSYFTKAFRDQFGTLPSAFNYHPQRSACSDCQRALVSASAY
ncbi:helix-turn-helix transcriptional regulator [Fibrella forsythiae]|uniref:Helix-turn-helix transcriptional regulator n=1 Tax=Fibrella forsythiae TaxID=2817061 RepID=A0ABS3JN06_9BACT|nr:helix-turn-helix transcriptional regulator [Fibrella forsythiae]MBO0951379.1 helix-turn-helix transcriptional regulator [Fibrella forsythiae]